MIRHMQTVRDGPRCFSTWPDDMRAVRDSAFGLPPLTWLDHISRRRRFRAESRYPHLLTRHSCWVVRAERAGVLVGYAWAYSLSDCRCDYWINIDDVAVHAAHQGRGIGSALITELIAWLRESGAGHISGYPLRPAHGADLPKAWSLSRDTSAAMRTRRQ